MHDANMGVERVILVEFSLNKVMCQMHNSSVQSGIHFFFERVRELT
jgi:hypothetical protein